jgi:hypothetical protein
MAVESRRFPYAPFSITVGRTTHHLEALIDTEFEGDVVLPEDLLVTGQRRVGHQIVRPAGGTEMYVPIYLGVLTIGDFIPVWVRIVALGDEALAGRGVIDRYRVILDHGRRVIVEP